MPRIIPEPLYDRVLVNRIKVKDVKKEESLIVMINSVEESSTDFAEIIALPDVDILAKAGMDAECALLKKFKVGDEVMISKYVGSSFFDNQGLDNGVFVRVTDIMARIPQ